MEIKTYKCPNCGAQITNTNNCEYCGSLLVRFEAKGIQVNDMSSYLDDGTILPGLLKELKQNLELQKNNNCDGATLIQLPIKNFEDGTWRRESVSVLSSSTCAWVNGEEEEYAFPEKENKPGLAISLYFEDTEELYEDGQVKYIAACHERFKQMEFFDLFAHRRSDFGGEMVDQYIIDFGTDAEGAAHLITNYIKNVLDYQLNAHDIKYDTNRYDIVLQHKEGTNNNNENVVQPNDNEDEESNPIMKWLEIIGGGIVVLYCLSQCFG